MEREAYITKCKIRDQNKIFRKAIGQVILLNNRIYSAKDRYDRARQAGRRSIRYSTRLQMAAAEGTRNMYYQFATLKCEAIELLQDKLMELSGEEYDFSNEENNFLDYQVDGDLKQFEC